MLVEEGCYRCRERAEHDVAEITDGQPGSSASTCNDLGGAGASVDRVIEEVSCYSNRESTLRYRGDDEPVRPPARRRHRDLPLRFVRRSLFAKLRSTDASTRSSELFVRFIDFFRLC